MRQRRLDIKRIDVSNERIIVRIGGISNHDLRALNIVWHRGNAEILCADLDAVLGNCQRAAVINRNLPCGFDTFDNDVGDCDLILDAVLLNFESNRIGPCDIAKPDRIHPGAVSKVKDTLEIPARKIVKGRGCCGLENNGHFLATRKMGSASRKCHWSAHLARLGALHQMCLAFSLLFP